MVIEKSRLGSGELYSRHEEEGKKQDLKDFEAGLPDDVNELKAMRTELERRWKMELDVMNTGADVRKEWLDKNMYQRAAIGRKLAKLGFDFRED